MVSPIYYSIHTRNSFFFATTGSDNGDDNRHERALDVK